MFLPTRRLLRAGVLALASASAVVAGGSTVLWTMRHVRAIQRLDGRVGGTTFLDAAGRPWFELDEERVDVPLEQIATAVKDAVIAVEDHRFYLHPGLDPIGLTRALFYNVRREDGQQGGSTLSQQLARTLFLSTDPTYVRKAKEAALAIMLEGLLSKRTILELYLNRVYLSGGVHGVEAMSRRMFDKPASALTLGEAALMAGIIRAPARYSPWTHLDAALRRRAVVLRRMREEGKITPAAEAAARAEPVRMRAHPGNPESHHGYAKAYVRQQFRALYGDDDPAEWSVRTTFVPELQDAAERAVAQGLRRTGVPGLQASLVALDPATGDILALVGGADFNAAPFNRAVRSHRQPGSAFKPFVYAAALEAGLSPVSVLDGLDQVQVQASEGLWIPRDEQAAGRSSLTLREGLVESSNAAAVALQVRIGRRPVLRLVGDLGVREQPDVPSLALGSGLVTPLALTAAYAVFPSMGQTVRPRGIVAIEDAHGQVMRQVHVERQSALRPAVAYQMVSLLQDVVERGTGRRARALGVRGPVGGKTGTTNDAVDAWFVGFSSSVVVGVWVGFDSPRTIRAGASGADVALPIWAAFMRDADRMRPARPFERPAAVRVERLCRVSHKRALAGCAAYEEYFKDGDAVPSAVCPVHQGSFPLRIQRAMGSFAGSLYRRLREFLR